MAFDELIANLKEDLPDWTATVQSGSVIITGTYELIENGVPLDVFQLEIHLAPTHPKHRPKVYETGKRIKPEANNHVNGDGSLCLFVEDEASRYWSPATKMSEYLNGPVKSYLIGFCIYEETGKWVYGERRHHVDGVVDFYMEELNVRALEPLKCLIEAALHQTIKGHHACPCGLNVAYRKCHLPKVQSVQKLVPPERLEEVLKILNHNLDLLKAHKANK